MTFSKPSTITSQSGAYAYKRGFSSTSLNYIDNSFPYIVDTRGCSITGPIVFLSGSSLTMAHGTNTFLDGYVLVNGGGVFAGASIEFSNGALLQLDHSSAASIYCEVDVKGGGNINWDSGSIGEFDAGSNLKMYGTLTIEGSGVINTNGDQIMIQDGTFPTFANTQSVNIQQPCIGQGPFTTGANFGSIIDEIGAYSLFLPFTHVPMSSTLTRVDVNYVSLSNHTAATQAYVQLCKVRNYVGLSSVTVLATINPIPTSFSGQGQVSFTGLTEAIDGTWIYGIREVSENGSGAQSIVFYGCSTTFAYTTLTPF